MSNIPIPRRAALLGAAGTRRQRPPRLRPGEQPRQRARVIAAESRPAARRMGRLDRRRHRRPRPGLEPRRPPVAHDRRVVDRRGLRATPTPLRGPLRDRGHRLHRARRPHRPAGGCRHLLPRQLRRTSDAGAPLSAPVPGRFRTAPAAAATSASSGPATPPARAGASTRPGAACASTRPCAGPSADFFIHCGDTIYADGPIQAGGASWPTARSGRTSSTAGEEQGRRDAGRVPRPPPLQPDGRERARASTPRCRRSGSGTTTRSRTTGPTARTAATPRYTEKRVAPAAGARDARLPRLRADAPARRGRGGARLPPDPPTARISTSSCSTCAAIAGRTASTGRRRPGAETAFLGREQIHWLQARPAGESRATWKVIAADMPIGLLVPDGKDAEGRAMFESLANGDGPALGPRAGDRRAARASSSATGMRNIVWITADVHYTAAHHYDPARAQFTRLRPFWEFVSGPLHAGSFGPNAPDNTFGMEVVWQKAARRPGQRLPRRGRAVLRRGGDRRAQTGALTVMLKDMANAVLWQRTLEPERG